jgi:hypothetical protein
MTLLPVGGSRAGHDHGTSPYCCGETAIPQLYANGNDDLSEHPLVD